MKIEVLTKLMDDRNKRTGRWLIVAIDAEKDMPVDLATVRYNRSDAIRERNKRAEWWSEQDGVETVVSGPVPMGS